MVAATPLQRELRQTRPFESQAHEAVVGLFRSVTEARGLTIQQFNVLRILRGAPDNGLPTLEIAERMVEQTPGITRLLDRLERKDLVSRVRCTVDRRQVLVCITPAGLDLLASLDAPIQLVNRQIVKSLSKRDQAELIRLLDRLRAATGDASGATSR
jgi:DNA-binding MarR family transcriptional regulator